MVGEGAFWAGGTPHRVSIRACHRQYGRLTNHSDNPAVQNLKHGKYHFRSGGLMIGDTASAIVLAECRRDWPHRIPFTHSLTHSFSHSYRPLFIVGVLVPGWWQG